MCCGNRLCIACAQILRKHSQQRRSQSSNSIAVLGTPTVDQELCIYCRQPVPVGPAKLQCLEVHSAVGRPWAQYLLGNCYEFGSQGLSRSFEQAAILYRQAAEQNYCQAMFSLGNLFRFGLGVNRCLAEASKWFALAAQCGDVTALYVLGILYFDQKRYDESFWQCQQAAIKGMVPAMRSTALLIEYRYAKAANTSTLQEAIYWYTLAAEHNDTQSQYRLFLCLSPSWRRRVPQEPLGFVDRPALVTSEDNSFVSTSEDNAGID